MNVPNVTKFAKCVALFVVGVITGGSTVAVIEHSNVSRYKKVAKHSQDTCEKALHVAEKLNAENKTLKGCDAEKSNAEYKNLNDYIAEKLNTDNGWPKD